MREGGQETSITRQAADPTAFFASAHAARTSLGGDTKPVKQLKLNEHTHTTRIQALALAEASISAEKIQEITGIDPRTLAGLRKLARERGYDPSISMLLKEEYVVDPPNAVKPRGRPKKRKPEDDIDPAITGGSPPNKAPPGYVDAASLPPGNWDFSTPTVGKAATIY